MQVENFLNFINNAKELRMLDCATCDGNLVNMLDLFMQNEQFTQKFDLGIVYLFQRQEGKYIIVDGIGRIISLSLLLHAVCECYKKTTSKNEKAIKIIRTKYLLYGQKVRLVLPEELQDIYNKIIFGERLSGKEKAHPLFVLLHELWSQIKEEKYQAANIFNMLEKFVITTVDTYDVSRRDLYLSINKEHHNINQMLLIDDYLKGMYLTDVWNEIKDDYLAHGGDIDLFFKDFFITKFNFKSYYPDKNYEIFTNYFETMLKYMTPKELMEKIRLSMKRYCQLLNVKMDKPEIQKWLVQIKIHNGDDTLAYLLTVYEDFCDGRMSEATFVEILKTIDEYLQKRQKNPSNMSFNDLISYLNAFIICK